MSFKLTGVFSDVVKGFDAAWSDLKGGATDVANFITTQGATVTKDTTAIGAVISAAVPGAAAVVSVIEGLESEVMAIVLAGAQEIENANEGNAVQTVTALKALLPQITALQTQLSTHPAVVAANK